MSASCCRFCASILANHVEVGEEFLPCYANDATCAYPLHGGCRKIFARMLGNNIEKRALQKAMRQMCRNDGWDKQFWNAEAGRSRTSEKCLPANELDVFKPAYGSNDIVEAIRQTLPVHQLARSPSPLLLERKVRRDPFAMLPYDVVVMIGAYLPLQDITSLTRTSSHVSILLHNDSFWKRIIRRDILPWFWEIDPLPVDVFGGDLDFRKVYEWLNGVTKSTGGGKRALVGVAYRRRIWRVCKRVGEVYWKELRDVIGSEDMGGWHCTAAGVKVGL